jgi:hypothetical protein
MNLALPCDALATVQRATCPAGRRRWPTKLRKLVFGVPREKPGYSEQTRTLPFAQGARSGARTRDAVSCIWVSPMC